MNYSQPRMERIMGGPLSKWKEQEVLQRMREWFRWVWRWRNLGVDKNEGLSVTHLLNLNFETVDVACALWRTRPCDLTVVSALEHALTVIFRPSRNRRCCHCRPPGFLMRVLYLTNKEGNNCILEGDLWKNSVLEGDFIHIIIKNRTIQSKLEFGSSRSSISWA